MDVAGAELQIPTPLYPSASDRSTLDDELTARLDAAALRVAAGSVVPDLDPAMFSEALAKYDFETPQPLADVLLWVIHQLEHGVVHLTHPSYFGLFNPAPTFPAECAERIVARFNPQLASSRTSPVAVAMEAHVIAALARRAGMPAASAGHFTSGGSEANFTALTCALTRAEPGYATGGARAFEATPVFYVSQDAHSAWYKIAHQAGIGRAAVRPVATDASGRMDAQALAAAIADDEAGGCRPVMVVATAGTTGAGMIDPIAECASVAARVAAWLHVDAAWGGALLVSERLRGLLAGIETADSVTIDAHKWLATTMACGMFITRDATILGDAFNVASSASSFMPSNIGSLDPYVTTAQWSRRFLGLRLFLSLAAAGWSGYADHVERSIELAALLRDEMRRLGWNVANDTSLAVLCLDPPEGFPDATSIASQVVASGRAWVASTRFRGRDVLRICVTNGQTMPHDILALAELLQALGPVSPPSTRPA
nr:pyridoxal-dependent decarboxylase [uncultured Lichenicoccus sp.]